jgi:hypothetical protein
MTRHRVFIFDKKFWRIFKENTVADNPWNSLDDILEVNKKKIHHKATHKVLYIIFMGSGLIGGFSLFSGRWIEGGISFGVAVIIYIISSLIK